MVVKQQLFKNFWLFLLVVTYVAFALFLSGSMLELLSSSSDLKSPSVAEIMFNQAVLNVTNFFLRNITIVYFNKGSGMDNCPYRLHIL
jgi:hypothetical protein